MNLYIELEQNPDSFKDLKMSDYIRENHGRIFFIIIISAMWYTLIAAPFYLIINPSMTETAAQKYINYLKNEEYQKAIEYYTGIPSAQGTGNMYINSTLKNRYDNAQDINVKSIEKSSEWGEYKIEFEVVNESSQLRDHFYLYKTSSSFLGLKKEWKVIFPFKTQDITIAGPDGSVVFIDGIESGEIKDGNLHIGQVIYGLHSFEASISNIAKSDKKSIEINEGTAGVSLEVVFNEDFKKHMDGLLADFVREWSNYCLNQNSGSLKNYLTERLYREYMKDSDRFNGSKYVTSECSIEYGKLEIKGANTVFYTVDEKWHLKEIITIPDLVFKDNYKSELEQYQYIKSRYQIVNKDGSWKIDSVEQLEFKQEIVK